MHFSARANWMMFTKEERRNIAIYILGISMSSQSNLLRGDNCPNPPPPPPLPSFIFY